MVINSGLLLRILMWKVGRESIIKSALIQSCAPCCCDCMLNRAMFFKACSIGYLLSRLGNLCACLFCTLVQEGYTATAVRILDDGELRSICRPFYVLVCVRVNCSPSYE